jgi:hypothetical protein
MKPSHRILSAATFCFFLGTGVLHAAETQSQRMILAHYMPWYTAKPFCDQWGWHWTMSHFNPERITDGKREIASKFQPLIGPYDSGDPVVLEYHLLLMKLAGIDGVIVDWYGLSDYYDYATLHRNTQQLVEQVERLGMKLAICYEDQTIPALVNGNRLVAADRVSHAVREIEWMAENWFKLDTYARVDNRPVLLSFGHAGLTNDEWTRCLERLKLPILYFSEHIRRDAAAGAFDWPLPKQGVSQVQRFNELSSDWPHAIPVAFSRFVDVYAEAGVSEGHARIKDNNGRTLRTTLQQALASDSQLIQIATWNDWGEGTQIEPSVEFGYRDLEFLQQIRRQHVDAGFKPQAADLRIPYQLLQLRQARRIDREQLDGIAESIATGRLQQARSTIKLLNPR